MIAVIGVVLTVLGGLLGVMMTVPESVALANLRSYWVAAGLAPQTGAFLGFGIAATGVILIFVSSRNRKSPRRAMVEAKRVIGSEIDDNYSELSDAIVKAKELQSSSVQRNVLKTPDKRKGK